MHITNISEAKASLSKLIEKVLKGEEVVIGKSGKPVAKLIPYDLDSTPRKLGAGKWQGQIWMADDFDDLPEDILTALLPVRKTKMNLLLDTHAFLWAVDNNPNLSPAAREAIIDGHNIVYVSAASAWEISIKRAIGKLKMPQSDYLEELRLHRFTPLSITTAHALAVENLPRHHKDPFDRMLIAQAREERLALVTHDQRISAYDVRIIET